MHTQDCQSNAFMYHAATGGDADCICGVIHAEVTWDDTPPSMNAHSSSGIRSGWQAGHKVKKNWDGIAMAIILQSKLPKPLQQVEVEAIMRFPDKRRRDEGNYRIVLEKSLGDMLVQFGYLPDDTGDHYRFTRVRFDPVKGPKQMILRFLARPEGEGRVEVADPDPPSDAKDARG